MMLRFLISGASDYRLAPASTSTPASRSKMNGGSDPTRWAVVAQLSQRWRAPASIHLFPVTWSRGPGSLGVEHAEAAGSRLVAATFASSCSGKRQLASRHDRA